MQVFESSCILVVTHVSSIDGKEPGNERPCHQFVDTLRLRT